MKPKKFITRSLCAAGVAATCSVAVIPAAMATEASFKGSESGLAVEFKPISQDEREAVRTPEKAAAKAKIDRDRSDVEIRTDDGRGARTAIENNGDRQRAGAQYDGDAGSADFEVDISGNPMEDGTVDYSGGGIILPPGFDEDIEALRSTGEDVVDRVREGVRDEAQRHVDRTVDAINGLRTEAGIPMIDPIDLSDLDIGYAKNTGERLVELVRSKLGSPYVWGAEGPDTFDCSGLMQWAYNHVGIDIPRVSYDQLSGGKQVPVSEIKPGDIVGWNGHGHVGMYIGDGKVIHAPQTGDVVKISPVDMMPIEAVVRYAE